MSKAIAPKAIDNFLLKQDVPGVIAVGLDKTDILYEGAFGFADASNRTLLDLQTPHSIMSMTKPVTSLAIMMLVESGAIKLDAPAIDYVPEYQGIKVLSNVDVNNKTYAKVDLTRQFTIRHLLTHTSGFGHTFCNEELFALMPESNDPFFGLIHQPGEAWAYSISVDVLGEVLTAVMGKGLLEVFNELIFSPLGMNNTKYGLVENMASPHVRQEGKWQSVGKFDVPERGGGGLVTTAADYVRLLQCFLKEGAPLISKETFASMIRNQIGDLFVTEQPAANSSLTYPFPSGGGVDKFGLGFQVHQATKPGMRNPGSYSWCGLLNTYFWGDPVANIGGIVLMQVLPLYEPVCIQTLEGFERELYKLVGG